jgi:tetratricopeptide (TPR) repeat protein
MQNAAKELYDARQYNESNECYKRAEQYCESALQRLEHETAEVQKLHATCKSNRSLCYLQSQQYEKSFECCEEVIQHEHATSTCKLIAAIRAGQSLSKLCTTKTGEEDKKRHLKKALEYCEDAEKMIAADATLQSNACFSTSLKQLRKEIIDKQLRKGFPIQKSQSASSRVLQLLLNPLKEIQDAYVISPYF